MKKPDYLVKIRRYLAKHGPTLVLGLVLITISIAILARGDRILRINYESDDSRLELNSSPSDVQ